MAKVHKANAHNNHQKKHENLIPNGRKFTTTTSKKK